MKNQKALDRYTFAHLAVGYGVGRIGIGWQQAIAGAVLFEAIEDALKEQFPVVFPEAAPDSKFNALADIFAFLAGYAVAAYQEERKA
jgi:hypothetical protein